MSLLSDPFAFQFFPKALIAGAIIGALCGALGVFVVLKRMSYIGQGLSQSVLGGVAPAAIAGVDPYLGAVAATIAAGVLIHLVGRQHGVRPDAAIGIVSTTLFAAGVALVSANRSRSVNLTDLLFGNILAVSTEDILVVAGAAVLLGVLLFVFYKPLVFTTVDPVGAAANGIATSRVELLSTVALAAVVVVSIRVVGVLLIAAVIVIPASTARLGVRSFGPLIGVAALLGGSAAVVGMFVSFHADVASGPAIVLVSAALFVLAALGSAAAGARATRSARARHRNDLARTGPTPEPLIRLKEADA